MPRGAPRGQGALQAPYLTLPSQFPPPSQVRVVGSPDSGFKFRNLRTSTSSTPATRQQFFTVAQRAKTDRLGGPSPEPKNGAEHKHRSTGGELSDWTPFFFVKVAQNSAKQNNNPRKGGEEGRGGEMKWIPWYRHRGNLAKNRNLIDRTDRRITQRRRKDSDLLRPVEGTLVLPARRFAA
jgi:hypothetical protein